MYCLYLINQSTLISPLVILAMTALQGYPSTVAPSEFLVKMINILIMATRFRELI